MNKHVLLCSGPTCVGKTTTLDAVIADPNNNAVGCFIGREMRRRHPPEYFDGAMASEKTEPEVRDIFMDVYVDFLKSDKQFLLCDGIPRLPSQVRFLNDVFKNTHMEAPRSLSVALVVFTLSDTVRAERMRQRGGTASEQALAEVRFHKDKAMLQDVYDTIETVCDWKHAWIDASGPPDAVQTELMLCMGMLHGPS